jgi:superfamily II DNA or RNA helicase
MIVRIDDNKWIYLDQLTTGAEESVVQHFSVRNPRAYFIDTGSGWDGWYRKYNTRHQRLARPLLKELIICCKNHNIPLEIDDRRGAPTYPNPIKEHITEDFIDGIKLEAHQIRGMHAAIDQEVGLFSMETGGGKTEIMCGIFKMFRCPTLIITEQLVVLEQIVDRLKLRNVVHNDDIGKFCHGETLDNNLVMVGSIQSLNSPSAPSKKPKPCTSAQAIREGIKLAKKKELPDVFPDKLITLLEENPDGIKHMDGKYMQALVNHVSRMFWENSKHWYKVRKKKSAELQDMARKADLLMVDECDKATSPHYKSLFDKIFIGRRRYGFSATPFEKSEPHKSLLLKERLGSIIASAGRKELEAIGRIIPIKYVMLAFGEDGDKQDATMLDVAEREILIENPEFHQLVLTCTETFSGKHMILVDTGAIEELGHFLEDVIPSSKFIYGKTSKSKRRQAIKDFEEGNLRCLIGGKILKRGLDLKGGTDNLILIGGGKKVGNLDQMLGRSKRINERGYARVIGFFILNNKYMYGHSRAQLKAIVGMGYKTTVLVGGQELDGAKLIRSRFRLPKRN